MSSYRGPRLKIIRRLGTPLPGLMRLNGDLRRPYAPGQHGPSKRSKLSGYALRLREKQKLRFHYGISEKQLSRYMTQAFRQKKNPGLSLLIALETRLDNILFRAGFAPSMAAARQMCLHRHILVNDTRVNIPSYSVQIGDMLGIRSESKMKDVILTNQKDPNNLTLPNYLVAEGELGAFKLQSMPAREDIPVIVNEQLIVEYYSGN